MSSEQSRSSSIQFFYVTQINKIVAGLASQLPLLKKVLIDNGFPDPIPILFAADSLTFPIEREFSTTSVNSICDQCEKIGLNASFDAHCSHCGGKQHSSYECFSPLKFDKTLVCSVCEGRGHLKCTSTPSSQNLPSTKDALFNFAAACCFGGHGVPAPRNFDLGVEILQRLSKEGHREAGLLLGVCYYEGAGVKKDDEKAFSYVRVLEDGFVRLQDDGKIENSMVKKATGLAFFTLGRLRSIEGSRHYNPTLARKYFEISHFASPRSIHEHAMLMLQDVEKKPLTFIKQTLERSVAAKMGVSSYVLGLLAEAEGASRTIAIAHYQNALLNGYSQATESILRLQKLDELEKISKLGSVTGSDILCMRCKTKQAISYQPLEGTVEKSKIYFECLSCGHKWIEPLLVG